MMGALARLERGSIENCDAAPGLGEPIAETLVKALFLSLTDAQREEICFLWDHRTPTHGLLRSFIANHWQISRPCIRGDFFTAAQQSLIYEIFLNLIDPDWRGRFLRQLENDTKGHPWGQDQSIAILGDPFNGPYQFLLTGRHLTLRADGGSCADIAFGGPVVYGHAATGFWEKPHHPDNIFWRQAHAASRLYEALDGRQKELAEVDRLPEEWDIGFRAEAQGICRAALSPAQKPLFSAVLSDVLEPFRAEDRARVRRCLARQGGEDCLSIAFSRENRISAPQWDTWRLEGPAFVWHFQGYPHVHTWVNVASAPGLLATNAHRGAFIFPEHDPLH
jgi:hypothetical protein